MISNLKFSPYSANKTTTSQNSKQSLYSGKSFSLNNKEKDLFFKSKITFNALTNTLQTGESKHLKPLFETESNEDKEIGLLLIRNIGKSEDIPMFLSLLNHPDENIKKLTIETIGDIGEHKNIELIKPFFNASSKSSRAAATSFAKLAQNKEDAMFMKSYLDRNKTETEILSYAKNKSFILEFLSGSDYERKKSALRALNNVKGKEAADLALPFLKSEKSSIREIAVQIIGKNGNKEQILELQELFDDANPDIAKIAAKTLIKKIPENLKLIFKVFSKFGKDPDMEREIKIDLQNSLAEKGIKMDDSQRIIQLLKKKNN